MAFTLTGTTLDGDQGAISWDNGELSGDESLMLQVEALAEEGADAGQTPTGPFFTVSLTDPVGAFLGCASLFRSYKVSGTIPELPPLLDLPEGATP